MDIDLSGLASYGLETLFGLVALGVLYLVPIVGKAIGLTNEATLRSIEQGAAQVIMQAMPRALAIAKAQVYAADGSADNKLTIHTEQQLVGLALQYLETHVADSMRVLNKSPGDWRGLLAAQLNMEEQNKWLNAPPAASGSASPAPVPDA